jgi:hypothetical protein
MEATMSGNLFVAIAATVFLLVHLPWTWTTVTGERTSLIPESVGVHRFEWAITLFALPLLTSLAGLSAWREERRR